jgi:hypothetical protein
MSLRRFALLAILFVVLVEGGLAGWRVLIRTPSTDPVFSWPEAVARFDQTEGLASAMAKYRADHSAEVRIVNPDGVRMTVLYLEWDRIESRPAMGFASHPAEECNVGLGYRFLGVDANRVYEGPGATPLRFDCTRFADLSGEPMFMFKMAWIQGVGAWQVREEGSNRIERLRRSFIRHTGAARILQAGVFGAKDAESAWQSFREQVLDQLTWR